MIPQDKRILIIESDPATLESIEKLLARAGYQVTVAPGGGIGLDVAGEEDFDMVIAAAEILNSTNGSYLGNLKEKCHGASIVALTGSAEAGGTANLLTSGVEDYVSRPIDSNEFRRRVDRILEYRDLRMRVVHLQSELAPTAGRSTMVHHSPAMEKIHQQIVHVAPTRSTVLILGESGVGKELVARSLHSTSPRRSKPFIPINCAAIPETLIESELFGHEKGAFTGAYARAKGKFELAHQGTIFLDEIGEMNLGTQVKLLRVLDEQEFMRLGGTRTVRVDVRVVAATNSDLKELIRQRRFREDLYFRFKVVTIEVPPLRDWHEDMPQLVTEFMEQLSRVNNIKKKTITPEALEALFSYDWPGNVRELKNLLESLIVSGEGTTIGLEDLPGEIVKPAGLTEPGEGGEPGMTIEEMEKDLILKTLGRVKGSRQLASGMLKIWVRTLQRKILRFGIDPRHGK